MMTTPRPFARSQARGWVSGLPRGLISRRGRLSCGTASSARARMSAFITMPGPPPAGVSSTVRCLSVACTRMSWQSSRQMPEARALPARLTPSGPGNISGKIVSTDARHMVNTLSAVVPAAAEIHNPCLSARIPGLLVPAFPSLGRDDSLLWRHHDDAARTQVDRRHRRLGERQQQLLAAARRLDLDNIAGAEIMDRGHLAQG